MTRGTRDAWQNLKAGNLNKRTATLGLPLPAARRVNTRQYRFPFSDLNTDVVDLSDFYKIEQPGMAFGLGNASSFGAVAIVHVNVPGNPVYITPGTPKDIPEGFERLWLERPTEPPVPSRSDLFYIFDLSDRIGGIQYGPSDPRGATSGADNFNAPATSTILVLAGAAAPPQLVLAARAGRRAAVLKNTSPGVEIIGITLDGATVGQDFTTAGLVAILAPGETLELPYTGAIYAFADAITATLLAWEIY